MLEMEIMDLSAQLSSIRPEWAEVQLELELWTVLSLYSFASRSTSWTEPNAVSIYSHHNDNEINQSQCFDCTIRVRNKTRARHYQYPVRPGICSNRSQKRVHQHHVEKLLEGKSSPHDVGALW